MLHSWWVWVWVGGWVCGVRHDFHQKSMSRLWIGGHLANKTAATKGSKLRGDTEAPPGHYLKPTELQRLHERENACGRDVQHACNDLRACS